jgi:hypothetical protein
MRKYIFICFIAALMAGCKVDPSSPKAIQKIKKQAAEVAENFVKEKLKDPIKNKTNTTLEVFIKGDTRCLVDPSYFVVGEIDEDDTKDVIVTIYTMVGQGLPLKEHLLMLNKKGKLSVSKIFTGEMRFLKVDKRIIYIETSHVSPDSPYSECQLCKEIHQYKYVGGDTLRVQ